MAKDYKTSQGKSIDFDKLMIKNEKVRAVGNMNVNARGDVLDSDNKNISTRAKQVNHQYRKQTAGLVRDMPVVNSKKAAKIIAEKYVASVVEYEMIEAQIDGSTVVEKVEEQPLDTRTTTASTETMNAVIERVEEKVTGGLAAAIAKAREVKQEPVKTHQEKERSKDGVKKI